MTEDSSALTETRGRPRIRSDEEILSAALQAFSHNGFEDMSLRSLNRDLGLSHGTINQRFGSKEKLFYAAVDLGFGGLIDSVGERAGQASSDGSTLGLLREAIRALLIESARRPELGRLMNREGQVKSERLDYIWSTYIGPQFEALFDLLQIMTDAGTFRPVSGRAFFFLFTSGAAAPYTLSGLSDCFDELDGPLDEAAHADLLAEIIIDGLRVTD